MATIAINGPADLIDLMRVDAVHGRDASEVARAATAEPALVVGGRLMRCVPSWVSIGTSTESVSKKG